MAFLGIVADIRAHRLNVWEDVIQGAEGYDEEATAEADPSETNEEAVFADGSRLWWNHALGAWETGPKPGLVRPEGSRLERG